jgi:hypothetical protein
MNLSLPQNLPFDQGYGMGQKEKCRKENVPQTSKRSVLLSILPYSTFFFSAFPTKPLAVRILGHRVVSQMYGSFTNTLKVYDADDRWSTPTGKKEKM